MEAAGIVLGARGSCLNYHVLLALGKTVAQFLQTDCGTRLDGRATGDNQATITAVRCGIAVGHGIIVNA
ncbi:hypothetical protein D3C87_1670110 [compost metagenome]